MMEFHLTLRHTIKAPFDSHTMGQSRLWRFNTYAGDWRVPARIYREWNGAGIPTAAVIRYAGMGEGYYFIR